MLSPLEINAASSLAQSLLAAGLPLTEVRVFGSRARGHSHEMSDLDLAVMLDMPPDAATARRVADAAGALTQTDDSTGLRFRVQAVPLFRGQQSSGFARAIALESRVLWTRT